MPYLCRKIKMARWETKRYLAADEISADAITSGDRCVRTISGALSVWVCSGDRSDLSDAALAIASNMTKVEAFHLVLLDENDLDNETFPREPTDGVTPVRDLVDRHRTIVNLDVSRLCRLARMIAQRVREDSDCHTHTVTKDDMLRILVEAVRGGRARLEDFNDKLEPKIRAHIGS